MSTRRNATVYSAASMLLVIIACGVLVVVVLPNTAGTFHEFKTQLPFPTRVLLAVANLLEIWPPLIVGVGILAALATLVVLRRR